MGQAKKLAELTHTNMKTQGNKKDNYFYYINILLLCIVIIGFAPSFYLRPVNYQESLPLYLIIHGISCTAWFLVIVLQSYLVQANRVVQHRTFGKYFILIAPALVISGLVVLWHSAENYHAQFVPLTSGMEIEEGRRFAALLIAGDFIQLIVYSVFVYLGYRYRSDINLHKRAMLIASILITQQALVRLGKFELLMIGEKAGLSGSIYAMLVPILLLVSLLVFDSRKFKKPQKISIIGIISYLAFYVSALVLAASGLAVLILEKLR